LVNCNIGFVFSDNAQGKTNLIEAIYYLGHNRSFKTKTLKEIINSKADAFQLSGETLPNLNKSVYFLVCH
jgi:DNA replication and repair protein RecF